jgi:hypothetical protein
MLFLSTLRVWRCEVAARRARPISERKRTPLVRKRKPAVELLEDRVPMGTFFNGFGLGSANILPVGLSLPGHKPGSAAQVYVAAAPPSETNSLDLGSNSAALATTIASNATNSDVAGTAAQITEAADSLVSDLAPGDPFANNTPSSTSGGSEVNPPNAALHPSTTVALPTLPVQTSQAHATGTATTATPSAGKPGNEAALFQAVSTAAASAGKSGPGGVTPLSGPTPSSGGAGGGLLAKTKWYPSVGHQQTTTTTQHSAVNQSQFMNQFGALLSKQAPSTRVSPAAASTRSPLVGPIQDASVFIGGFGNDQIEESIAINPTNPNNIVVQANAIFVGGLIGSMLSYTFDNGNTWHPSFLGAENSSLIDQSAGDPGVVFDRFGNLWISYLDFGPLGTPEVPDGPTILLSTNGGIGYHIVEDLEDTSNPAAGIDQPKMAVGDNSIWVVWSDNPTPAEPDGRIQSLAAYIGGFNNWQGFFSFNDGPKTPTETFQNFGKVAVGPNGQVVYTFQDPSTGPGPDTIWMSLNPLGTRGFFGTPTLVTTVNVGGFAPVSMQPFRTIDSESEPAYDRSHGPFRGRLYMVYTDRPTVSSNSTDIFVIHSDNDGATWSPPVRVTDDHTGNPKILPRIRVDQTDGHIAVSWLDSRNDPGFGPGDTDGLPGTDGEEFVAFSADGGNTFSKNIQVSQHPSNAQAIFFYAGFDWGDYSGLDFNGGIARPAWPDNSLDTASVNTAVPLDMNTATAAVTDPFSGGGGGGGGGGFQDTLFGGADNDSSSSPVNEGVLSSSATLSNVMIGPDGTDNFPDQDWFKWTMSHSGTFTATETTTAGGPLELHIFKLVNGSIVDVGDSSTGGSLSTSVSTNDTIFVEVKGQNSAPGVFTTGEYNLKVTLA